MRQLRLLEWLADARQCSSEGLMEFGNKSALTKCIYREFKLFLSSSRQVVREHANVHPVEPCRSNPLSVDMR